MTGDGLVRLRGGLMGFAGIVCLLYGVTALVLGRPNPMPQWIPGTAGIAAGLAIFLVFSRAGQGSVQQAMDETYRAEMNGATRIGFWTGVVQYPLYAPFLMAGMIGFDVAFAAMGTITASAFLLSFALISLRGL